MEKIIDVDGITCDHCVVTIKTAIESLSGIIRVNVDIQKKQVIVEFNESLKDSKKILEKIGEAGFEVREWSALLELKIYFNLLAELL